MELKAVMRMYGWADEMGIPSAHMWVDRSRVDQDARYEELRVCDRDGSGIYLHMVLPSRAQYAISELDLCFVDHALERDWESGLCNEKGN